MDESRWKLPAGSHLLILLLVAAAVFFLRLDCALLEPEETRYAEIPREMLAAGQWIVPLYHGQPYFDKPPLLYWLVMISYSLFGVHDWAARLVPGCCGVLTVLATYAWGRRVFASSGRGAFLGALVLALTPRFIYLGRFVATDAVLSLCIVTDLACLHIAVSGSRMRWPWWLAGGLACGLGLLAKGPVALVLVGAPVLIFIAVNKCATRPGWKETACFLLAMLATAAPWYALMLREAGFAEHFFWKHHVQRFVEPFDHVKPFWFYLPDLILGTLPWSLLLVPLTARLYHVRHDIVQRGGPEVLLPLVAAAWCLLFFSASGCKRVGYVLPLFAPLALALGWTIDELFERGVVSSERLALVHVMMLVLCLGGINWALPWYNERFSLRAEVILVRERVPSSIGIACYPRGWDSVDFYLGRDDVLVFSPVGRAELAAYLRDRPEAVLFLRDDADGRNLLAALPPTLAVEPLTRGHGHLAVRVFRPDLPTALASRGQSP
jgi:dolichol-phosphate mannosyltransferase